MEGAWTLARPMMASEEMTSSRGVIPWVLKLTSAPSSTKGAIVSKWPLREAMHNADTKPFGPEVSFQGSERGILYSELGGAPSKTYKPPIAGREVPGRNKAEGGFLFNHRQINIGVVIR